jgi:hypothetical protein
MYIKKGLQLQTLFSISGLLSHRQDNFTLGTSL